MIIAVKIGRRIVSLCVVAALIVSIMCIGTAAAAQTAATPVERADTEVDRNFSGDDNMSYPMKEDDEVGIQFSIAADAKYVALSCPSWSDNEGSLTVALYTFNKDYSTSVGAEPIIKHEFVDYKDNAFLGFTFPEDAPLKAGEYVIEVTDAVPDDADGGGVGVWAQQEYAGQRFYENGEYNPALSCRMAVEFVSETEPEVPYGTLTAESGDAEDGEINYTPYLDCILKFTDEDADMYYTMDNAMFIDSLEITDEGYLAVEVTEGNDPQFYIDIPTWTEGPSREDYPIMLIRMKQTAGNVKNGEMYFSTSEFPGPTPGGSVAVVYQNTSDWQNVIVNLKSNRNFTGTLERLRFDIITDTDEPCSYLIDYILFFESVEAARAFKHEDIDTIMSSKPTPEPATPTPEITPAPATNTPASSAASQASTNADQAAKPSQSAASKADKSGLSTIEIVIIAVCAAVVIAASAIIIIIVRKTKKNKQS